MEQYRLSFARVNIVLENIVEVVIDNFVVVSLEMVEELDKFLSNTFTEKITLLINKVNTYSYSFEAKMIFGSLENIIAIAVINYSRDGEMITTEIMEQRKVDNLNIKSFSALDLGYQHAIRWLKNEMIINTIK